MAKFYGVIGYAVTKETAPGVWTEEITEQSYYGDLTRNMRRLQDSGDLNDDINVANEISIVADPAANLYFLYCFTAKWSGLRSSKSAKSRSTGLWYSSSSSRASLALISSSSVVKFISSAGASYQM